MEKMGSDACYRCWDLPSPAHEHASVSPPIPNLPQPASVTLPSLIWAKAIIGGCTELLAICTNITDAHTSCAHFTMVHPLQWWSANSNHKSWAIKRFSLVPRLQF